MGSEASLEAQSPGRQRSVAMEKLVPGDSLLSFRSKAAAVDVFARAKK
jgi:hypothetical protein